MNDRILHKLDFARKLLLTAVALLALVAPVVYGLLHATPSQAQTQSEAVTSTSPIFDTVSIKRHDAPDAPMMHTKMMFSMRDDSFIAQGVTLRKLIQMAYPLQDDQLLGGPDWLDRDKFDVSATISKARAAELQKGLQDAKLDDHPVLKALLADYFKVSVHQEMRNLSAYELTVDDGGSKLKEVKDLGMFHLDRGELLSGGVPIELLANQLSGNLGRVVVDKTGLKGIYSFDLRWTPDPSDNKRKILVRDVQMKDGHPAEADPPVIVSDQTPPPPLLTAIQEQLGLKLEPKTEPVPVLVVDHAEQPTEN